jgi:molybdopterin biosynthesis enzyme
MMPDGDNGDHHVETPKHQVEHKEQEVTQVVQTYTVVDPRAVMVHEEDTALADGAVVGPHRLDFFASEALTGPELLQLRHGLVSVSEELLDVAGDSLPPVILLFVNGFTIRSILLFGAHLFHEAQIFRTHGLY